MLGILKKKLKPEDHKELLVVLKDCLQLLETSEDSDWSEMGVKEISEKLANAIVKLEQDKLPSKRSLKYLFLAAAPLQEIAMANGWSDQYIGLSSRFDVVCEKWD